MVKGIKEIRRIKKSDPGLFEEMRKEYMGRKCRDFCSEYGIGVSSALFEFGRKVREKPPKPKPKFVITDEEVVAYQAKWKEQLEGRMQKMNIASDIDPYYSGAKVSTKSYYH